MRCSFLKPIDSTSKTVSMLRAYAPLSGTQMFEPGKGRLAAWGLFLLILFVVRHRYGQEAGHDMGTVTGWLDGRLWVLALAWIAILQLGLSLARLQPRRLTAAGTDETGTAVRHRFFFHKLDPVFLGSIFLVARVHQAVTNQNNPFTAAGWTDLGEWGWALLITGAVWLVLLAFRRFVGIAVGGGRTLSACGRSSGGLDGHAGRVRRGRGYSLPLAAGRRRHTAEENTVRHRSRLARIHWDPAPGGSRS